MCPKYFVTSFFQSWLENRLKKGFLTVESDEETDTVYITQLIPHIGTTTIKETLYDFPLKTHCSWNDKESAFLS